MIQKCLGTPILDQPDRFNNAVLTEEFYNMLQVACIIRAEGIPV
jgi:hypothetical protein